MAKNKKHKLLTWTYGIVYDTKADEYFTAEIYKSGKNRFSFCAAPIYCDSLINMNSELINLSLKVKAFNYYVWDGRKLKHAYK